MTGLVGFTITLSNSSASTGRLAGALEDGGPRGFEPVDRVQLRIE